MASLFARELLISLQLDKGSALEQSTALTTIDVALLPIRDALRHAQRLEHAEWVDCKECPKFEVLLNKTKP